jgi:hypothetical protein
MKSLILAFFAMGGAFAMGQQPAAQPANPAAVQPTVQPADALAKLAFMEGDWAGKQNFNTDGGAAMVGDATDSISLGIAGKYLCEMLSTTLPNRKPTDTRHFISFDKQSGKYTAWWFNDTSYHPTQLTGELTGNKLVLTSGASGSGPVLRATYEGSTPDKLTFQLEMKNGESWTSLFVTNYRKKSSVAKQ